MLYIARSALMVLAGLAALQGGDAWGQTTSTGTPAPAATPTPTPAPATGPCQSDFKCSLQAAAAPDSQPWNDPAAFAYTVNNKGKDSFAIDASGKGVVAIGGPVFVTAGLSWNKNNQQEKQQNNFQASLGLHFEFDNTPDDGPITPGTGNRSLFVDAQLAYNRKSVFPDLTKPLCTATPNSPLCQIQVVESIRATLAVAPHFKIFDSTQPYRPLNAAGGVASSFAGPTIARSFGIVATGFSDTVTRNVIDPDTGKVVSGTVVGGKVVAGGALSPKFTNYRLVLRFSGQLMQTVKRDTGRRDDFNDFTHLVSVSLDLDLGSRTFATKDEGAQRRFRPSVGVTFADGEDPLAGRKDQSTFVIGFKLAFR